MQRHLGQPPTTVAPVDEDACEPVVGQHVQLGFVLLTVMDRRQLIRRAVLAPRHRLLAVDNERGMRPTLFDIALLQCPIGLGTLTALGAVGVEVDAPAPTEHPVVATRQIFKQGPGIGT